MLTGLTIRNIVLIDQLSMEFKGGFCALTGETGAGKSILLDSLGLALGMRADAGLVRRGAEQASVTAEFQIPPAHPVHDFLKQNDIVAEDTLLFRRILAADGRSRAFINDQPVSASLLREAGAMLVEIHGQFDTQGLFDVKTHKGMLDLYAGLAASRTAILWQDWQAAKDAAATAAGDLDAARREQDYLRASLQDLEALSPQADEEEALTKLRERLMHREKLLSALNAAHELLAGEDGAESRLNAAYRALDKAAGNAGPAAQAALAAIDRAAAELQEAALGIEAESAEIAESEHSLSSIDDRLFALKGQARKHGCAIADLPALQEDIARRLSLIDGQDDLLSALERKAKAARAEYLDAARLLTRQRLEAAGRLDAAVAHELPPLKMDKARFVTRVEPLEDESGWGPQGVDQVRFLVATNPGAEPGPLQKIASGGETSRFMLALKVVLADMGIAPTLIFDEVDSGIGGSTAAAVGERLARLAEKRQILVVTHAPQVAACADHHFIVQKNPAGAGAVTTTIFALDGAEGRREEIARMISGAEITPEARAAATRLLESGA